jgi:hypothetical protein
MREPRPLLADHAIDFVRDLSFDLRVPRQQVIRPRQGERRRLVSGQQHGQHLVAELTVGHTRPGLLVARREEHG